MKSNEPNSTSPWRTLTHRQWSCIWFACAATAAFLSVTATAQIEVQTLGGGRLNPTGPDAGFVDGNALQTSQFNTPLGLAVDAVGQLFVADSQNGAVRKLDLAANRSTTVVTGLDRPVDVVVTAGRDLFILTQGDGRVRRLDRFGNIQVFTAQFDEPTAIAVAPNGGIYVSESGGAVVFVDPSTHATSVVAVGLVQPRGIAVLESGLVAVSESGRHRLVLIDPSNGNVVSQIGTGFAGFRDGSVSNARFNTPHHLAKAPDGSLLVADRGNHRVRWIQTDGTVTTLYGKSPESWEGPQCLTCDPIILPGWFDGPAEIAESREPAGIAVSAAGAVYTSEVHYHLIRETTGLTFADPNGGGGPGELPVLPPVITPEHGYFPMGQQISVSNPNTNAFFSTAIYYTTDGTVPTTNSLRVPLEDNAGSIFWRESTRDLTSLRVVAYVGARASEVVSGRPAPRNEIGVTRDITAGIGSTIVIPVVANLRPGAELKSLQFLVQVSPENAGGPPIPDTFRLLSVSTNDFIRVVTSSDAGDPARFSALPYRTGATRGFAVTFIGANANLSISRFAVVAMLAVPIPTGAAPGDRYWVEVLQPSGTSDAAEEILPLVPMERKAIVAGEVGYRVGDSSPATWYNADHPGLGFGDGGLNNNDVNNVFAASLGERVPYRFSDLFDSMDAFPVDTSESVGGDGLIRFLDWQVVLLRSLGLDGERWMRTWTREGERRSVPLHDLSQANRPASFSGNGAGLVWQRNAVVMVPTMNNVQPGTIVEVPVHAVVWSGSQVSGLAFRAKVEPANGAPAIQWPIEFGGASGDPGPMQSHPSRDVLLCGWPAVPQPSFSPAIEGVRRLGVIRIRIPGSAEPGHAYRLVLSHADGAPDLRTQYAFETRSALIWIRSSSGEPEVNWVSDDWKRHFFGVELAANAHPNADPDTDGMPNWAEYAAGTDPTRAASALALKPNIGEQERARPVTLRWQSVAGKVYAIQSTPDLQNSIWKTVADGIEGDGTVLEWSPSDGHAGQLFYRLQIDAPNVPPASIDLK